MRAPPAAPANTPACTLVVGPSPVPTSRSNDRTATEVGACFVDRRFWMFIALLTVNLR
jgi:hypothetical protein